MFLFSYFKNQIREFAHYQYYCIIFIDDHVWCTFLNKNEITRTRNFFRCQKFEFAIFFDFKFIRARNICFWFWFDFSIFAWSHRKNWIFCIFALSHRNDLKNHYRRDFRIWQIRIVRNKLFQQIVFIAKFHCRNDDRWRCYVHRVCCDFDDIMIKNFYFVSNVDFHTNDLIVLQNKCFSKTFENTFRRRKSEKSQ